LQGQKNVVKWQGKGVNHVEEKNIAPLASEMYEDLKETNRFLRRLLIGAFIVIGVLVIALAGTNIYHIHQWSQFDTVVVDSGEGGNANLVQGDNTGGIFNGESGGTPAEEGQIKGD